MRIERVPGAEPLGLDEDYVRNHLTRLRSNGDWDAIVYTVAVRNPRGQVCWVIHTRGRREYKSCLLFWYYLGFEEENSEYAASTGFDAVVFRKAIPSSLSAQ